MSNSTASPRRHKRPKPSPDFPLFWHASGRWAKKIKGRIHYFGKVEDDTKGQAALETWLEQKDDLLAGRVPRKPGETDGATLRELCNRFLTYKQQQLDSGEISQRTFRDYHEACEKVIAHFGRHRLVTDIRPTDFDSLRAALAKGRGPVSLCNHIQRIRTVFKYGYDVALLDVPVRFGTFKKPSAKVLRIERARKSHKSGRRMFQASEIRQLLDVAPVQLRAMILLGINCGFGQSDCSALPISAVNFDTGWIDYPRGKTGIERRCPLWPETVEALRVAIDSRPTPLDDADAGLVFITKYGRRWVKATPTGAADDAVCKELAKLLDELGIRRQGVNFYALRHTFLTVGSETGDETAVGAIMGHVDNSMAAAYRERIGDNRLRRVTEHVRAWLFGQK